MTSHSHPLALPPDSLTYLKLSLVAMIWGGTFVAGRYLSADTPALLAASVRFIFAGITLGLFLGFFLKKSFVRLDRSQLVKIVGLGFCGIYTYNLCFFLWSTLHSSLPRVIDRSPESRRYGSFLLCVFPRKNVCNENRRYFSLPDRGGCRDSQ